MPATTETQPGTSSSHRIGTREEWRAARLELLQAEKDLTYRSDDLARQRQALPWVRVDKKYRFETENGEATLRDLFNGRSQLIIYHFMFGPDYKAGCPSCSGLADTFNGNIAHLENHDVAFWAISRAPLPRLLAYRERMGWTFPWASAAGSDFNADYGVGITEAQQNQGHEYNFRQSPPMPRPTPELLEQFGAACGVDGRTYVRELPGMSAFALEDGVVYHTYSAYSRGLDGLWGMYQWLDRAPRGRNEASGPWLRRHDEYTS